MILDLSLDFDAEDSFGWQGGIFESGLGWQGFDGLGYINFVVDDVAIGMHPFNRHLQTDTVRL